VAGAGGDGEDGEAGAGPRLVGAVAAPAAVAGAGRRGAVAGLQTRSLLLFLCFTNCCGVVWHQDPEMPKQPAQLDKMCGPWGCMLVHRFSRI